MKPREWTVFSSQCCFFFIALRLRGPYLRVLLLGHYNICETPKHGRPFTES